MWRVTIPFPMAHGARVAALCALLAGAAGAQSLDAPLRDVTFTGSETLRDVVAQALGDPDLWPVVLTLSGIPSPDALRPGTVLRLPVAQVQAADGALRRALDAIQAATAEGAQLFAPTEIGAAVENREAAVVERSTGAFRGAVRLADTATGQATEALRLSLAQRDRAAEALLTDAHGDVEGRTPVADRWTRRTAADVLVEFERVRTLSASTAQITFRDLSRLRLNANSNATIQTMRTDPLTGEAVTKVNLVSGDFYALLNQLSDRTDFALEVGGIETATDSSDFWVSNDADGAKFANYDAAALVVGSGDGAVALGQNEGAVIGRDGRVTVADVLVRPALEGPGTDALVFAAAVPLRWSAVADAAGYWVEVAADAAFNEMRVSDATLTGTGADVPGLPPGRYHWRVAALDAFGLPSAWSLPGRFERVDDATPPFVLIASPAPEAQVATPLVTIAGETEPGATLTLDGAPVAVDAAGRFAVARQLVPGANAFALDAADVAGNRTSRAVAVTYRPAAAVRIDADAGLPRDGDGRFLTAADTLAFVAATDALPGSAVAVRDAAGAEVLRAVVEAGGRIGVALPAGDAPQDYRIAVLSPDGADEGTLAVTVLRDRDPPVLRLDPAPPPATATAALPLAGSAAGAVALTLDGAPVPLDAAGRFALDAALAAGPNRLTVEAVDAAGNTALLTVSVVLDTEAPEVLSARVVRGAGGAAEVVVEARDAVGLRAVARYEITRDGRTETGFLRCEAATGTCRGAVPGQGGAVALRTVTVEDYAGNSRRAGATR